MENQNTYPDKDPVPKNMVPNQNPKPLPQKDRSRALGNKDIIRRVSESEKSAIKADRKNVNK